MRIPNCPECGDESDVFRNLTPVKGEALQSFDWYSGTEQDFNTEHIEFEAGDDAAILCSNCGASRTDIRVVDEKVEVTV